METLYLLPGTMCNETLWRNLAEELGGRFHFEYLSIPNHLNFEQLVEHYQHTLPSEPINLVGFSLGGYIASYLACKSHQRIKRLMVLANSPTSLPDSEVKLRTSTLKLIEQYGYKGMSKSRILPLLEAHNDEHSDTLRLILEMDKELGQETFASQYRHTTIRRDLTAELASLNIPLSFMATHQDGLVDQTWFEQFNKHRPETRLRIVPGQGHYLPLEQPLKLSEFINDFFKG